MEDELALIRNVNTLLLHQPSTGWSRFILSKIMHDSYGSPKTQGWWTNQDDALNVISAVSKGAGVDENVDKIHPIGSAKNGNQARIIKFTTHSFNEKVFQQHKQNKKIDNGKKKKSAKHNPQVRLNVQPSLQRNRIDLLRKANEAIEGN